MARLLTAVLLATLLPAAAARGEVIFEAIDVGVPTAGGLEMTGFRGFVFRLTSDEGPITRVRLDQRFGGDIIAGFMANRWLSPSGRGFAFGSESLGVVTTPGPLAADNSDPGDPLNFDSHLLPAPAGGAWSDAAERDNTLGISYSTPANNPIPSTPFVGHVAPPPVPPELDTPFFQGNFINELGGDLNIDPAAGVTQVDLAYVVTDRSVSAVTNVWINGTIVSRSPTAAAVVPEPAGLVGAVAGLAAAALGRRRRLVRGRERPMVEPLEPRRMLAGDLVPTEQPPLEAVVDRNAGQVSSLDLAWYDMPPQSDDAGSYQRIRQRAPGTALWTERTTVSGSDRDFAQLTVGSNEPLEVEVQRALFGLPPGNGYFSYAYVGIDVPATHDRGTVLLLVDRTQLDAGPDGSRPTLRPEIDRLRADLIADGYRVVERHTPRTDVPRVNLPDGYTQAEFDALFGPYRRAVEETKGMVLDVAGEFADLESVLLLGHVPVPYSGNYVITGDNDPAVPNILKKSNAPDGHGDHFGAWVADLYYGHLDPGYVWPDELTRINPDYPENSNYRGDGKFDKFELPDDTDVTAAVGRIDFHGLPHLTGVAADDPAAATAAPAAETLALKTYLDRLHDFRHDGKFGAGAAAVAPAREAAVDGWTGLPFRIDVVHRLTPLVGFENIHRASFRPRAGVEHLAREEGWLFATAGGPGSRDKNVSPVVEAISLRPGDPGANSDSVTGDFLRGRDYLDANAGPHRAVFNLLFGSYAGDWDKESSLLRSSLADPDGWGLAATLGDRPTWRLHPMALGEPIGTAALLTQNDDGQSTGGYPPKPSSTSRAMHTSLLGDPSLRLHYFEGASDVRAAARPGDGDGVGEDEVVVSWVGSGDADVLGYHVYRADRLGEERPLADGGTEWVGGGDFERVSGDGAGVAFDAGAGRWTFSDLAGGEEFVYMVRAEKLEQTPSGTYFNLSTGAFSRPVLSGGVFGDDGYGQNGQDIGPAAGVVDRAHRLTLAFSEDVGGLDAGDLRIEQIGDFGGLFDPADVVALGSADYGVASYDSASRTVIVVFNTTNDLGTAGALADGVWRATVVEGAPTTRGTMAGAHKDFVVLTADANDDGAVTIADFAVYRAHFGESDLFGDSDANGDFNYDGEVTIADFAILRDRFGQTLSIAAGGGTV